MSIQSDAGSLYPGGHTSDPTNRKRTHKILLIVFASLVLLATTTAIVVYFALWRNSGLTSNNSEPLVTGTFTDVITDGGIYNVSGPYTYSLVFNTTEPVTVNLMGCMIIGQNTSAIQQLGKAELIVNVVEGTVNVLSDAGDGTYDGCIFSKGPLTITGSGLLQVTSHQTEGEGISTKNQNITINGNPTIIITAPDDGINAGGKKTPGTLTVNGGNLTVFATGDGLDSNKDIVINDGFIYTSSVNMDDTGLDSDEGIYINGGFVVSLGMGIFEPPVNESKQFCFALKFDTTIPKDTLVTMTTASGTVMCSFITIVQCNQIIFSMPEFHVDTYYVYMGGSNTAERIGYFYDTSDPSTFTPGTRLTAVDTDEFVIESEEQRVYVYGKNDPPPGPPPGPPPTLPPK